MSYVAIYDLSFDEASIDFTGRYFLNLIMRTTTSPIPTPETETPVVLLPRRVDSDH